MRKEQLNKTMNCECLQSIIKNDEDGHLVDSKQCGSQIIKTPNRESSEVIFKTFVSYHHKIIDSSNNISKDKVEPYYCSIPFLFCPICGTKSKQDIPENSFYFKFQK